jgi:REP element-mobilizing transposase RayT
MYLFCLAPPTATCNQEFARIMHSGPFYFIIIIINGKRKVLFHAHGDPCFKLNKKKTYLREKMKKKVFAGVER